MLGTDALPSGQLISVAVMTFRRHGGELGRQRRREGAMRDLGRLQHERVHCFGEGRVQRVGNERFGDLVTAGYQGYLILLPTEGQGLVVMTNSDNGSFWPKP